MDDRELLEFAAKAIGARFVAGESKYIRGAIWGLDGDNFLVEWNPLTDDGDALRLAISLNIAISFVDGVDIVIASPDILGAESPHEGFHPDKCSATRRAIVRAAVHTAAEIGRSMP